MLTFFPILPVWLIVIIAFGLLLLLAYGSVLLARKNVPMRWVTGLAAVRVVAVALLVACLVRPVLSFPKTLERKSNLLVLLDTSASMAADTGDSSGNRLRQALETMERSGLLKYLDEHFDVYGYAFDRDARPVPSSEWRRERTDGNTTQLAKSLRTAYNDYRHAAGRAGDADEGATPAILVSDGNDLGADDPVDTAQNTALRLYAVSPPEPETGPTEPSVSLVNLQAPRRVLLGSECRFRATLRQDGRVDAPVHIELSEDGEPVLTHDVSFDQGESERQVTFAHRPVEIGARRYSVRVYNDAAPGAGSESDESVTVQVLGRNNRVLVFADTWRWSYKYLRRVFEDDPSFTFTSFLTRGSGIYMQFAEPDRTVDLGGFPQSRAELEWFDIFVLSDVDPRTWPDGLAPTLARLVVEQGKSLVVVAGPSLWKLAQSPDLEPLLPVQLTRESAQPIDGPIAVRPPKEAMLSPFFYNPTGSQLEFDWSKLPPMDHIYPPLRKRPAATILLEAPEHTNPYGALIVMAEHTVGRGRVLFIGTDTLWKWQTLAPSDPGGNTPFRIFWQQALRTLTPDRPATAGINLWLQTDKTRYVATETVHVTAEVENAGRMNIRKIDARVSVPKNPDVPIALVPDASQPTLYRGDFEATVPGQYEILADLTVDGQRIAEADATLDVEDIAPETAHRGNNRVLLERLTAATAGRVVDLTDTNSWPRAPSTAGEPVMTQESVDLWSSSLLLICLVLTLGLDWLLRLLHGFA